MWVSHAMQSVEQYPQPLPTSYDHFPPVMTTHNVSRYCQISPRVGSKIAPHWDGIPYRNVRQDIFHHGTREKDASWKQSLEVYKRIWGEILLSF